MVIDIHIRAGPAASSTEEEIFVAAQWLPNVGTLIGLPFAQRMTEILYVRV